MLTAFVAHPLLRASDSLMYVAFRPCKVGFVDQVISAFQLLSRLPALR